MLSVDKITWIKWCWLVIVPIVIHENTAALVEKSLNVCNGPCGQLSGVCPTGQRLAIRDAVYRVQHKTSECAAFPGCTDVKQDICCASKPQDCVFPYSLSQLRALQRNCSGASKCVIQTARSESESSQCGPTTQQRMSSQTVLNYVCLNESLITDICSPVESVVTGRSLFALLDPRTTKRLDKGSSCTCKAESVRATPTNTIAVFVVDLRLNKLDANDCANTSLSLRSGNNQKNIDCASSRDPMVSYPFVAVVNDSNVAYLKLQVQNYMPEFVWIGFESNEDEDIRLSCQLQAVGKTEDKKEDDRQSVAHRDVASDTGEEKSVQIPAIIGGVVAGILLIVLIVVIILMCKKNIKCCPERDKPLGAEHDAQVDFDIYYSTTDDELRNLQAMQTQSARNSTSSMQELYISPEDVRANKRRTSKRLSAISIDDFDDKDEYVTTFAVQGKKRLSDSHTGSDLTVLTEPDPPGHMPSDYDRLDRQQGRPVEQVMESYDRLVLRGDDTPDSPGRRSSEGSERVRLVSRDAGDMDGGAVNPGYDDTERLTARVKKPKKPADPRHQDEDTPPDIPPKLMADENPTYDTPRNVSSVIADRADRSVTTANKPGPSDDDQRVYSNTVGRGAQDKEMAKKDKSKNGYEPTPKNAERFENEASGMEKGMATLDKHMTADDNAGPVAAPRRKKVSATQPYDIAKPIE